MARVSGFDVTDEQKLFLEWVAKATLESNAAYFRAKIQGDIKKLSRQNQCRACKAPEWACACGGKGVAGFFKGDA